MSNIQSLLIRAGVPHDLVALVGDAIDAARAEGARAAVETMRCKANERQRRYDAKKRSRHSDVRNDADLTSDVTQEMTQEAHASRARSLCLLDSNIPPVILTDDIPQGGRSAGSRGTRISADWQPGADEISLAVSLGFAKSEIPSLRDEFVEYWQSVAGARGRKANWNMTFRVRLRDLVARRRPNNRAGPNGSGKVSMLDVFNEIGRSDEPDYLTPDYSVGGFNDPPNVARIGSGAVRR